jgi:hypothetical protein
MPTLTESIAGGSSCAESMLGMARNNAHKTAAAHFFATVLRSAMDSLLKDVPSELSPTSGEATLYPRAAAKKNATFRLNASAFRNIVEAKSEASPGN